MHTPPRRLCLLVPVWFALACASSPEPRTAHAPRAEPRHAAGTTAGQAVVEAAVEMLGAPYRYGGANPGGFDCSGLVIYSYGRAGYPGLPHSASGLAELSRPVSLDELAPGDLMIFELSGKKPSHVGIYVGNRRFIHAPSSGGEVELVDFDHVYWGRHIAKAGRLLSPPSRVAWDR